MPCLFLFVFLFADQTSAVDFQTHQTAGISLHAKTKTGCDGTAKAKNAGSPGREAAIKDATKEGCNINWALGNGDDDGGIKDSAERCDKAHKQNLPATSEGKGRAILGFNEQINKVCTGNKDTGTTCVAEGYNRLRFGKDAKNMCEKVGAKEDRKEWNWNTCKNLHWLLCAAQGFLPGQSTKEIFIIPNPPETTSVLTTFDHVAGPLPAWLKDPFDKAHKLVGNGGTIHDYIETGVTNHELCLLSNMCLNSNELWNKQSLPDDKGAARFNFICKSPDLKKIAK
jgi:hypothetical protein